MDGDIFEISADTIVVEVRDKASGRVYRRELPVDYYENANFLSLSGENLDGAWPGWFSIPPGGWNAWKALRARDPTMTPAEGTAAEAFKSMKILHKWRKLYD